MAKRKRLNPAQAGYLAPQPPLETKSMGGIAPPIAQVAGDASSVAALQELSDMVQTARKEGRLISVLPLEAIDAGYLVRDRISNDTDDLQSLIESIRARGQQTAIEVVALKDPEGGAVYGLISGWRRLTALRALFEETGDARFCEVKALITNPATASDKYLAMVEENEIRVGLSYYERAHIAVKAVETGVFPNVRDALRVLFSSASRSKRSKIKSFVQVVETLDGALRFPTHLGERLGLDLARRIGEDAGFGGQLVRQLKAQQYDTAEQEQAILRTAVAKGPKPAAQTTPAPAKNTELAKGIHMQVAPKGERLVLSGPAVDPALIAALSEWIKSRNRPC